MMRLHLHSYSKWSAPFDSAHDYKKLQCRVCATCNKVQVKPISQPWNCYFNVGLLRTLMEGGRNE